MVAYYFSFKTALVKGSPNVVAANATVLIYDVADVNRVTPITAYTDAGLTTVANLVTDAYGIVPDFYTDNHPDILWKSGTNQGQWATSQSRPGLRGPTGPQGQQGVQGVQGSPGLNGAGTNAEVAAYITPSGPTRDALDTRYAQTNNIDALVAGKIPSGSATSDALDAKYVTQSSRGVAGGVATLDGSGRIPVTQIPAAAGIQLWTASTAYAAGQQVISPAGDVVAAYNAHTSGATFNPNNWYGDFGWLVSVFTANGTNGEKLSFFYSHNGKTVQGGGGNPAYTDPNTGNSLRDPSTTKIGSLFVEAHTVNNGINKNFAVLTGSSLANLTQAALIDCSALPDLSRIWAPEIVPDPAAPNRPYIFFSKINAAGTNGSMWWVKATNDALTTWTAPVRMSWTAEPAHYIDGVFIQKDGVWYFFYSTGSDILRATSTSLTGTYTTDRTGNWAGWGTGIEGPEIAFDPASGKYRIYIDRYQSGLGYGYSESSDLNTWSALTALTVAPGTLPPGGLVRHGSFFKIPDSATRNAVLAQIAQPFVDQATTFSGSYNQGTNALVSNVGTPAQQPGTSTNDLMVTADGAGKFTFKEAGEYQIFGTFAVTAGTGVNRSFAELANAAGTATYVRTPGAAEDSFQLNVLSYRAAAGEQILIRTFLGFTGGGSATINTTLRFIRRSK